MKDGINFRLINFGMFPLITRQNEVEKGEKSGDSCNTESSDKIVMKQTEIAEGDDKK